MSSDFSRILSNLRKEKNISQRKVAEGLEISQALLSHYEKGMREPGLAFVVRVANYYNVSCDYLLGRSITKDGCAVKADDIFDASEDKDNVFMGSASAMIQKKLIVNSISVIFDIIGKTRNKELVSEVSAYLYFPIYKIYRFLIEGKENSADFAIEKTYFECLCDAEMKIREAKIKAIALNDNIYSQIEKPIECSKVSPETLKNNYPKHATSLFTVIQSASDIISITTNPHTKTKPKKNKKS